MNHRPASSAAPPAVRPARTTGVELLIIVAGAALLVYRVTWWVLVFRGFYASALTTSALIGAKRFLPADLFVLASLGGFVVSLQRRELAVQLFGWLAVGGVTYGALRSVAAISSDILPADLVTELSAWPYLAGAAIGALVLWHGLGLDGRRLGSAAGSGPVELVLPVLTVGLVLYGGIWWFLVAGGLYTSTPDYERELRTHGAPDLFLAASVLAAVVLFRTRRPAAYLVAFLVCGALLYRSAGVVTGAVLYDVGIDLATKPTGWPCLGATTLAAALLWRNGRRELGRLIAEREANLADGNPATQPAGSYDFRLAPLGAANAVQRLWNAAVWKVVAEAEQVDTWSVLIAGAQDEAGNLLAHAERLIEETKAPDVYLERRMVAPGMVRGMLGTKREFLVVRHWGNGRLRPYELFLGARPYGTNLDVYWYLMHRPGFLDRLFEVVLFIPLVNFLVIPVFMIRWLSAAAVGKRGSLKLDLFDESDLRAYVTNAHHCIQRAVEQVCVSTGQDPAKIDRRSKGFLGIS